MRNKILCPISQAAARRPEKIALIMQKQAWSYQQLDKEIEALQTDLNLSIGSKVAFSGAPTKPAIVLLFALLRAQAIAIPLNPKLPQTARPGISDCIYLDKIPTVAGDRVTTIPSFLHLDQLATFLLTSGSSKDPKIACLTVGNHYYSALEAVKALKINSESRSLLALPLFHVSGIAILMRTFLTGSTVVLSEGNMHHVLAQEKISHVSLVPTQLYRLLQEPSELIEKMRSTLRSLLIGGDRLPENLYQRAILNQLPIQTTYGMTEMSSMITLNTNVLPKRKLKITKDGEIWVRGKTLFAGYFDLKTQSLVRAPKWLPTGDIGSGIGKRLQGSVCDPQERSLALTIRSRFLKLFPYKNELKIIGRKDRLFISGGENIQPEEIEQALCAIPGVINAYVVPITDPEFGHRPLAYILEDKPFHTVATIQSHLREGLPSFKHPIGILPFTTAMKESFKKVGYRNGCVSQPLNHNVDNDEVPHL